MNEAEKRTNSGGKFHMREKRGNQVSNVTRPTRSGARVSEQGAYCGREDRR